jgi:hypothetical protein
MLICAETGETWTFTDMDLYSNRVANYFHGRGFQVCQAYSSIYGMGLKQTFRSPPTWSLGSSINDVTILGGGD